MPHFLHSSIGGLLSCVLRFGYVFPNDLMDMRVYIFFPINGLLSLRYPKVRLLDYMVALFFFLISGRMSILFSIVAIWIYIPTSRSCASFFHILANIYFLSFWSQLYQEKAREFQKKTSISALLTMPKPLTVWITINCGKFWKRWEYQTTWPASWEICIQVRKQQLELDMEQQTGYK